jgi:hypothetical protein
LKLKNKKQTRKELQSPTVAPLDCSSELESFNSTNESQLIDLTLSSSCNSEVGISVYSSESKSTTNNYSKYQVFVLDTDGKPLTPTTFAKAKKLLKASLAKKVWSKFGTFGIQLLFEIKSERQKIDVSLGIDHGTKFEGYSIVIGIVNILNIMLMLPDKDKLVNKLTERRQLRRARRFRNCRRRKARFDNRTSDKKKENWIAPSQLQLVNSRLKIITELFRIYPIKIVGYEDVRFNHAAKRWGSNFSTVEIGKTRIKQYIREQGAELFEFGGYQTKELREKYNYKKIKRKSKLVFESHCCDSLALACEVNTGVGVEVGKFIVVDDRYRAVRRRLHDTQPGKDGSRAKYSKGTVLGISKGKLIGVSMRSGESRIGRLDGEQSKTCSYYYTDLKTGKRSTTKSVKWISNNFVTQEPYISR